MSKRDFGTIKSILHFDFPYFNEPNDGLTDEASNETWSKAGNTALAGVQIPYARQSEPKFGYRCAYFPNNSSYITGTNNHETFNISASGNYEIEAFIKFSGAGNIFILGDLLLSVDSSGYMTLLEQTASTAFTPDTWQHVLLRIAEGYCTLYLDGVQVLGAEISDDLNPLSVQLGGFVGYMDEFVFRDSASSGTPKIPAAPYTATFDVGLVVGFRTSSDGDVTISSNAQINSYGIINSITDAKTFTINSWNSGIYTAVEYLYFNGHSFCYIPTAMTWHEAKAYCESLGGHLATSTSAEKNTFLANLTGGDMAWLGGTDENSEGTWEWITGENWDYTNWYSGEPSNSNNNEHYLTINFNATVKWNDCNATATSVPGFICEWDDVLSNETGDSRELMIHITAPISTESADYPNVGFYAFSKIASIDGVNITLQDEITTENGFDFTLSSELLDTYYIQVITVPHFKSLTINSGVTVTPLSWNTTTGGGIVAFRCKGNCTINGSIITHGRGAIRYDWCQMENSKLIDRFLCAQGGGIFITCGKTFTTSENARLGATWSGEGDGSNGAAGKGGNSGEINIPSQPSYTTYAGAGGVGGGGGGSNNHCLGTGTQVGNDSGSTSNVVGKGAGGCGGKGGNNVYIGGSGGGGQGNSGGAGGNFTIPCTNGKKGNSGTINGGNHILGYSNYVNGAGGGAPGGNGGTGRFKYQTKRDYIVSAGIAGSCIILLCKILNASSTSFSTGGSAGSNITEYYTTGQSMGCPGGGGTGFCYISAEEFI